MLDTGPLGRLAHRTPGPEITNWIHDLVARHHQILIPEIADYELRRNLTFERLINSLARLELLAAEFEYVPITTPVMRRAARLWAEAEARERGRPTADAKELDSDVILASQAIESSATVATDNVGHLAEFVPAIHRWKLAAK